ncbi:ATP-binding protein [Aliiglaciecola sp. LCG003]|uniref:ATP-binding protein n=1 Tax=Aliiglaciecola sp. LCG003 TaxID=3053655 RepID=UPI002572ACB9|nr:ATP-binding protein [Aliiglaciecola sp. LCG003]WJG07799.1 ATP-binding protein [Aliiglaciecola sp. LCG003]
MHAILMTIFIFDLVNRQKLFLTEQNKQEAIALAKVFAANGSYWILSNDYMGMEELITSQSDFPKLKYALFLDMNNKVLGYTQRDKVGKYLTDDVSLTLLNAQSGIQILAENPILIDVAAPVFVNDSQIGWARVGIGRKEIVDNLEVATWHGLGYTLIAIFIGIIFAIFTARRLTSSIRFLAHVAHKVGQGKRDVSFRITRNDELGSLSRDLDSTLSILTKNEIAIKNHQQHLEISVKERTKELEEANQEIISNSIKIQKDKSELENSYQQLQQLQTQLVEQEKFAALGQLIAGVAHELNTPLGIAITSASFIQSKSKELSENILRDSIKKSELVSFLKELDQAQELATRNLQRCVDLIASFKQVSTDQTLSQRRNVDVHQYLNEVMLTMAVMLKKNKISWRIQGEKTNTFIDPGFLAQVINNIINNAVLHAFEGIENKNILLSLTQNEMWTIIEIVDNGVGMTVDTLKHLFDPFFTTKRNNGGTGLGMNIVYNLVTQNMEGKITAESNINMGTKITLYVPNIAR